MSLRTLCIRIGLALTPHSIGNWQTMALGLLVAVVPPSALAEVGTMDCQANLTLTRPFLHEISKYDVTFSLLGTIHHGISASRFSREVDRHFEQMDHFTMEASVRLSWWTVLKMIPVIIAAKNPFRTRAARHLSESQLAILRKRMIGQGQSPDRIRSVDLAEAMAYARGGKSQMPASESSGFMDQEMEYINFMMGKEMHQLESFVGQLKMLRSLNTLDALKSLLDNTPEKLTHADLIQKYVEGDETFFTRVMYESRSKESFQHQVMFKRRNADWIPKIQNILKLPGRHLIAVGFMHLYGPDNLLDMFKRLGYTVRRVHQPNPAE